MKIFKKTFIRIFQLYKALLDTAFGTYSFEYKHGCVQRLLDTELNSILIPHQIISCYIEHKFDLLGSGWTDVFYGTVCRGLHEYAYSHAAHIAPGKDGYFLKKMINRSNLAESRRIWTLISGDYKPIDWQLDFKSGYRWSGREWYILASKRKSPGADIKVPWELARMQHLPQLALAFNADDSLSDPRIQAEFRNQVLDFTATNPPRYGVNWSCAMEVAIRAANLILAWEIFSSKNASFDNEFEAVFQRAIYEHGKHIVSNIEWRSEPRGNHYLANICGLTFIAAWLPSTKETNDWLRYAVLSLIEEVNNQFYSDGGNYEGSTAYHRFSSELVIYTTAVILGLSKYRIDILLEAECNLLKNKSSVFRRYISLYQIDPQYRSEKHDRSIFPSWYFQRIEKMVEFIKLITKNDGTMPQIGDNDNGRFFKLIPQYSQIPLSEAKKRYSNLEGFNNSPFSDVLLIENHIDARHIIAAACGIVFREDLAHGLPAAYLTEMHYVRHLARDNNLIRNSHPFRPETCTEAEDDDYLEKTLDNLKSNTDKKCITITTIKLDDAVAREKIELFRFPDFGLYIFRSVSIYLAIRCFNYQGRSPTSHLHNDQLGVELIIGDRIIHADPGSYVYSALPEWRNLYRSSRSHWTPWSYPDEPSPLGPGLFGRRHFYSATVEHISRKGFIGKYHSHRGVVSRLIFLDKDSILILDNLEEDEEFMPRSVPLFSPGYGILEKQK